MAKITAKISTGLYIPEPILKEAGLDEEEVEIEVLDHQIRINPKRKKENKGVIALNSPFFNCIGKGDSPGVNGRDHDKHLYGGS